MPITAVHRFQDRLSLIPIVALALLLSMPAPALAGEKKSKIKDSLAGVDISNAELRIRVRALAMPMSGIIEETADRVLEMTDDPDHRQLALLWKINSIPAFQSALFQPDPQAALLDAWALIAQVRNFHSTGKGATEQPKKLSDIALDGIDKLERELLTVAAHLGPPDMVEELRQDVETWAARHPITNTVLTRLPTASEMAELTADNKIGLRRTAAAVTFTMDDMAARLDVYNMYLPKQARWEAELMALQLMGGENLETVIDEFTRFSRAAERIAETVNQAPDLLTEERNAILVALQEERIAALEAVEQHLVTTLEYLSQERMEIFSTHLKEERTAFLQAIEKERAIVLDTLREERIAALDQLTAMTEQVVTESLKGLVDHFFLRLAQLVAVLLVIALIGYLILRRRIATV